MTQTQKALYITTVVLLFQTLRNINTAVYVGVLFISYGWLYVSLIVETNNLFELPSSVYRLLKKFFLISILWIPIISLTRMNMDAYLNSIGRYAITFPYFLFCYLYRDYNKILIKKMVRLFTIFILISSASILLQIIIGPLPFVEEPYIRAGVMRYASLAGNLNALGTLCGMSFVFLLNSGNNFFNKKEKIIFILIILIGSLAGMQKAAVVNVIISILLYIFFINDKKAYKKIVIIIVSMIIVTSGYFIFRNSEIISIVEKSIRYTLIGNDEMELISDLLWRLWELPSMVVKSNKMEMIDWIFGIGFPSLAGIMGNPQYRMAHNNYFDLIFSGGIIHFVIYLYFLLRIVFITFKNNIVFKNKNYKEISYASFIIILLFNMLIGGATNYQPVNAVIIYFIIFSFNYLNDRIYKK